MKKIYLLFSIIILTSSTFAQTFLYENFNSYAGSTTVPANWFFSANDKYTSAASSGPSGPNSFKFGSNGAYIISPQLSTGDSVSFFMKLNLSSNDSADTLSTIKVYVSTTDTAAQSFSLVNSYTNIPNAMLRYAMARNGAAHVKIIYTKVGGNIAFDDFAVYSGTFVGNLKPNVFLKPTISATQSDNLLKINWNGINPINYSIIDITGKTVKSGIIQSKESDQITTQSYNKGVYFIIANNSEYNSTVKLIIE